MCEECTVMGQFLQELSFYLAKILGKMIRI